MAYHAERSISSPAAQTYHSAKGKVMNYAVSIPWRKVRIGEVMLAWEMNGAPLPRIHGAPLRVVVFAIKAPTQSNR